MLADVLNRIYDYDKTSTFYRYMKILEQKGSLTELSQLITNELPYESYLELAITFYDFGFSDECIEILKAAPEWPSIYLWLAYLDTQNRQEWLESALNMKPDFVFPYRDETLEMLEYLMQNNEDWKLKYFASLIYWKRGRIDRAGELFKKCGDLPDYAPFYLAKAEFFKDDETLLKAALEKAKEIKEDDWRVNLAWIEQYLEEERYSAAADLASETMKKYPERSVLGLNYAIALLNLGEYKKCVSFLESFVMIPFEGATMGRNVFHEAAFRFALEELKRKKYKNAISYASKSLLWPLNLGSGKPYDTDERLENYLIAYCHKLSGRPEEARLFYSKVSDHKNEDNTRENAMLYLQVLALEEQNRSEEAERMIDQAQLKDPDNKYVKWVKSKYSQNIGQSGNEELIPVEQQSSPINNEFLLLKELLSIIGE